MNRTIYYVADPMCSWCYAFRDTVTAVQEALPEDTAFRYVMGGLAPDSDEPMPDEVARYIQENWRAIEERTGTTFNWDFWKRCKPRRSTYPACRAVLAAGMQHEALKAPVFAEIQAAYYERAENPSDTDVLIHAAGRVNGIDIERLAADLASPAAEELLQADFTLRRRLAAQSFPSLVLEQGDRLVHIQAGWNGSAETLRNLASRNSWKNDRSL